MKLQNSIGLFISVLGVCIVGCKSSEIYDPSIRPAPSSDIIKVESLAVQPAQPVAPEPWRVTMKIKNVSAKPLENVDYKFLIGGQGEQLGKGTIARLNSGETAEVTSNAAKVEQGIHRIEGRVFLPTPQMEPDFRDRMNNWMATNVVVAQ